MMEAQAHWLTILVPVTFGVVGLLVALARWRTGYNLPGSAVIFGLVLCILSYMLIDGQTRRIREFAGMRRWPTVTGTVLTSKIAGQNAFHPEVTFAYRAGGQSYEAMTTFDPPGFGGRNVKYQEAQAIVEANPPGKQVRVWYNPSNPRQAYLRIEPPFKVYGLLGIAGVAFGAGVFFVVATALRKRKTYRPL